jgi:hypothetical protein
VENVSCYVTAVVKVYNMMIYKECRSMTTERPTPTRAQRRKEEIEIVEITPVVAANKTKTLDDHSPNDPTHLKTHEDHPATSKKP